MRRIIAVAPRHRRLGASRILREDIYERDDISRPRCSRDSIVTIKSPIPMRAMLELTFSRAVAYGRRSA